MATFDELNPGQHRRILPGTKLVVLDSIDDPINVDEVLLISDDLNKEFKSQSEWFGKLAFYEKRANATVAECQRLMDYKWAQLRERRREEGRRAGTKPSKDSVDDWAILHPEYQEAVKRYNNAVLKRDFYRAFADASKMKADMLISHGANVRKEMEPELKILIESLKEKERKLKYGN